LVLKALLDQPAQLDLKAPQVLTESREPQGLLDRKASQGLRVLKVLRESRV